MMGVEAGVPSAGRVDCSLATALGLALLLSTLACKKDPGADALASAAPSAPAAVAAEPLFQGRVVKVWSTEVIEAERMRWISGEDLVQYCELKEGVKVACHSFEDVALPLPSRYLGSTLAIADNLGNASQYVVVAPHQGPRAALVEVGGQRDIKLDVYWPVVGIQANGGMALFTPSGSDTSWTPKGPSLRLRAPGTEEWGPPLSLTDDGNLLVLPWFLEFKTTKGSQVWARKLDPASTKIPRRSKTGIVLDAPDHLATCRTRNGLSLAFGTDELQVVFERDGHWSSVSGGSASLGPTKLDARLRFDCSDDGMTASWVIRVEPVAGETRERQLHQLDLHQVECRPSGCNRWSERVVLNETAPPPWLKGPLRIRGGNVLGRVGDERILVWSTPMGLRFRRGTSLQVPNEAFLPFASQCTPQLYTRGDHAFVLADAAKGQVVGARIDPLGTVVPLVRAQP